MSTLQPGASLQFSGSATISGASGSYSVAIPIAADTTQKVLVSTTEGTAINAGITNTGGVTLLVTLTLTPLTYELGPGDSNTIVGPAKIATQAGDSGSYLVTSSISDGTGQVFQAPAGVEATLTNTGATSLSVEIGGQ